MPSKYGTCQPERGTVARYLTTVAPATERLTELATAMQIGRCSEARSRITHTPPITEVTPDSSLKALSALPQQGITRQPRTTHPGT